MLYRKALQNLIDWKNRPEKKALLITGARQTGKTYLVREFAKKNYTHFVEINFYSEPQAAAIFSGSLNADTIIANLSAYTRKPIAPGKTLIFLDEIQECPEARTAIKFLVDDGRFDYIESGSLLGVRYKDVKSYPVGYETILQMYPMDFEEFCSANGVQPETFSYLEKCCTQMETVTESVHDTMCSLFHYYVIVGGMPAAVQEFVNSHDIAAVTKIQRDILAMYRQDIAKYAMIDKIHIQDIFDRIPAELNSKNRRFMLSNISKHARLRAYGDAFTWLRDAGVALPCYNVSEPKMPLKLNEQSRLFKLFLNDCGLLCAASMENIQFDILQGDLTVNMGSILENVFAQQLKTNGFELRYFNRNSIGEVDFIVAQGKTVLPIEIKSGKDYTAHLALNHTLAVEEWNLQKALVFCMGNLKQEGEICYLPWYMVMFIKQETLPEQLVVPVDLSGLI